MNSQGQALENAILANPDDLGAHAAYADWLIEQGDPRGEFIQVQLALEDPQQSAPDRKQLQEREQHLLKEHAQAWLGDLGRFLNGPWCGAGKPYDYGFTRGWLDSLRLLVGVDDPDFETNVDCVMLTRLAQSPEVRMVRRFDALYDMRYHYFDFEEYVVGPRAALTTEEKQQRRSPLLACLHHSPFLKNLRAFRIGFSDSEDPPRHSTMVRPFENCHAQQVVAFLGQCPRLEELYLNLSLPGVEALFAGPQLGNLRVLQYYFASNYDGDNREPYPLQTLARNPALARLQQLRLHPGRDELIDIDHFDAILRSPNLPALTHLQVHMTNFGNEGCRRIAQSGILRRLKVLDIAFGNMTDEGAVLLANCPDLKHLEALDVSRNSLTEVGIAALQATGIQVAAGDQHGIADQAYLYEVDAE